MGQPSGARTRLQVTNSSPPSGRGVIVWTSPLPSVELPTTTARPRSAKAAARISAAVPAVFALPLWIPELLLFGSDMFTEATPRIDAQPILAIPYLAIGFVDIVLAIWGVVLLCNTVAEVQGYRSAWRGLWNIVLSGAVIVAPLLLMVAAAIVFLKA